MQWTFIYLRFNSKGVGYLCSTLTEFGHNDVAYRLLQTDTFPSWGYSIKYNATTIWERWDGWTKEKGFQSPGMNSFNHYSLGSVGRWLYQSVIKPHPGEGLTYVSAVFKSINGLIKSHWETNGTEFVLKVKLYLMLIKKLLIWFNFINIFVLGYNSAQYKSDCWFDI